MKIEHPYHVIMAPILTEESTIQTEAHNKYVFKVNPRANKREIKEAIEREFKVGVVAVNTMNYIGKFAGRRFGASAGRRSNWKKAIVTLRSGDTIELI